MNLKDGIGEPTRAEDLTPDGNVPANLPLYTCSFPLLVPLGVARVLHKSSAFRIL
jgi:hypothetical protein